MCNQCSNDGNPLCETCLVEERLTLECQRLAALATASEEAARMYSERSARWEQEAQRLAAERDRMGAIEAAARALKSAHEDTEAFVGTKEGFTMEEFEMLTEFGVAASERRRALFALLTTPTEEPTR